MVIDLRFYMLNMFFIITNVNAISKVMKTIENLAEKHPYVVALLTDTKEYSCTGSIINSQTVLTSGTCVQTAPAFVAVGLAILNQSMNKKNIFKVTRIAIHNDYIFETKATELNITKMHSNIGLVFTLRTVLDVFIPPVEIGNSFASELKEKDLVALGFGYINSNVIVLQKQNYQQSPCENPKWYYCICGIEKASRKHYGQEFGDGAPVLFGIEIIAITASPCRKLSLKSRDTKYNIFTVIGPYVPWIERTIRYANTTYRLQSNEAIGKILSVLSHWLLLLPLSVII